jgi:hypothetical protein
MDNNDINAPGLTYEEIVRRFARRLIYINKTLGDRERRQRLSEHTRRDLLEELEALEAALPMLRLMEQMRHGEWN